MHGALQATYGLRAWLPTRFLGTEFEADMNTSPNIYNMFFMILVHSIQLNKEQD